jgi:hypothetical protein
MIEVASVQGMRPGDSIVVAGENTSIVRISGLTIKLSTSLATTPSVGDTVTRPAVTNVYLDDQLLTLTTDYTYSAAGDAYACLAVRVQYRETQEAPRHAYFTSGSSALRAPELSSPWTFRRRLDRGSGRSRLLRGHVCHRRHKSRLAHTRNLHRHAN